MENKKLLFIIEMAIRKEEEAYAFYMDLYGRVEDQATKDTLLYVAADEQKHKEFLVGYRDGRLSLPALPLDRMVDYRIAEYLEEPDLQKDMASKDVYLVAAHRETLSHKLYDNLAALQPEGEVKAFFLKMAREELGHKEKMEYLYANTAFPQTDGG